MKLKLEDFEKAYNLIRTYLPATPLIKNEYLSIRYKANIFLKLENLQPVGSFKVRGALNKIASLSSSEKEKGVLAVSAGNHAQGVAWATSKFNTSSTIIMPKGSPLVKVKNTEALGAKVILEGNNVDESFDYAVNYLKEHKLTYVHPFCDEKVIAGQGTIGFELKEQLEHIDYVFAAIGGGGLIAGMGFALKSFFKNIKIIGTQAQGACSMVESLRAKKLVEGKLVSTIADGIKVRVPNEKMYDLLDGLVDETVAISDDCIALSILELMEEARLVSEGAGAIGLSAFDTLYLENPKRFEGKNIVLTICGGNIDSNLIDRIIDRGLIESKRRLKMRVILDDLPGCLNKLTSLIKELDANILEVRHDRNDPNVDILDSIVELTVETKGKEHASLIMKELSREFTLQQ